MMGIDGETDDDGRMDIDMDDAAVLMSTFFVLLRVLGPPESSTTQHSTIAVLVRNMLPGSSSSRLTTDGSVAQMELVDGCLEGMVGDESLVVQLAVGLGAGAIANTISDMMR